MKESMKKNAYLLFFTILFSVLSASSIAIISLFLQSIIDKVMTKDLASFKRILIYTLIFAAFVGVFRFIYGLLSKLFVKRVTTQMRERIFSGIFKSSYKDFNSKNTADYISILTNDIKLVEENYIIPLLLTIEFSVMFFTTLFILLYLSPLVTLALFLSLIVMFLVPSLFGKALQNKQKQLSEELTLFTGKIKDMFLGFDIIKNYNLTHHIKNEFHENNNTLAKRKFNTDKLFVINETLSQLLGLSVQFVALFFSAYLVIKGNLTMGMLIAIIQLSGTFVQPIIMIMTNFPKIKSMKEIINKLDAISNYENENFRGIKDATFNSSIEIKDLTFSYNENKSTIKNINLSLEKNKKYAIVGPSGCGKSTLIKLLSGYYSNYNGSISFDENEIKTLNIEKLNGLISLIHQNVYMFDKTIKDNICLYKDFSNKELSNSLELSGAFKFISNLNEGLGYKVGENGNNLSGGQKQRVAIARALIQESPILVLDEGTSAIDIQTGYDIESKLLNIKDLTLVTITHKMSKELLNSYDEIIYMEEGSIKEKGHLSHLLKSSKDFSEFYNIEICQS